MFREVRAVYRGCANGEAPDKPSRKHAYIILTPLKPHFYIVKLGFTGVYIIFLISAQNIDCGYSLVLVLTSTHNLCFDQKCEKMSEFLSENFQFFGGKIFSIFE